jgi:hypothetical protein
MRSEREKSEYFIGDSVSETLPAKVKQAEEKHFCHPRWESLESMDGITQGMAGKRRMTDEIRLQEERRGKEGKRYKNGKEGEENV